jgi:hypothetical protein
VAEQDDRQLHCGESGLWTVYNIKSFQISLGFFGLTSSTYILIQLRCGDCGRYTSPRVPRVSRVRIATLTPAHIPVASPVWREICTLHESRATVSGVEGSDLVASLHWGSEYVDWEYACSLLRPESSKVDSW